MPFRLRLALLLVTILVGVQLLTWALVYDVTRRHSIADGERQLAAAADAFIDQLDDRARRIAASVQVLALDYPLRAAIAQHDRETLLSALRNHGRRVGAERMLLLDLDGRISADTGAAAASAEDAPFPFPDLLQRAFEHPAAAVVAIDRRAYWLVVVPVYAPQPVGLIAAGIPVDDALLREMQRLSALPKDIELVAEQADGRWRVLARGAADLGLARALLGPGESPPAGARLIDTGRGEYVALARALPQSPGQPLLAAVFGYSLGDALGPFRSVTTTWFALIALGLAVGAVGGLLIAGGVARPLEALARAAERIERGDYAGAPEWQPAAGRHDELAHLAAAFAAMTTAIREREQLVRFQAEHDAVTGLANRRAAEQAIAIGLGAEAQGALLLVGLLRLPDLVKTMGHALADRLIRAAAERLRQRLGDRLAARASDTELLVWLPGARRDEAIATAFAIRDLLAEPFREGDLSVDLTPVLGLALHPEHGSDAAGLLQHAEVALFEAQGVEEPVTVYDPVRDPHRPERLALMSDLREALEHGGLSLHFQPKLAIAEGRVDGAEGLVRWHHPVRGNVRPDEFIVLAEQTGNIRRLTRWVLAHGIALAARWHGQGRHLRLALNLSARDLEDAGLPGRVGELLAVHRLPPERLLLEVTESSVMGRPEAAMQVLRQLAGQGIDLAIDDFGVGQSSLAYLRRLPVRELKIDQSFVRRLDHDMEDRTIVRSIVDLGHRLGYRVTAEGVENEAALAYLREVGCDYAQGYFVSRPLPQAAFEAFDERPFDDGRRQQA